MRLFFSTVEDGTMAVPRDDVNRSLPKRVTVEDVIGNRQCFITRCGFAPSTVTGMRLGIAGNDRIIRMRNGNRHTIDPRNAVLAEALVIDLPFRVFAVAADCPIVGTWGNKLGGVAHNGWRGAAGVPIDAKPSDDLDPSGESVLVELVRRIREIEGSDVQLKAVMSPAVCAKHYTVHHDVARLFKQRYPEFVRPAGYSDDQGELFMLDVPGITRAQLQEMDVQMDVPEIEESEICTFEHPDLFSDRGWKQGGQEWGRMGILVVAD